MITTRFIRNNLPAEMDHGRKGMTISSLCISFRCRPAHIPPVPLFQEGNEK